MKTMRKAVVRAFVIVALVVGAAVIFGVMSAAHAQSGSCSDYGSLQFNIQPHQAASLDTVFDISATWTWKTTDQYGDRTPDSCLGGSNGNDQYVDFVISSQNGTFDTGKDLEDSGTTNSYTQTDKADFTTIYRSTPAGSATAIVTAAVFLESAYGKTQLTTSAPITLTYTATQSACLNTNCGGCTDATTCGSLQGACTWNDANQTCVASGSSNPPPPATGSNPPAVNANITLQNPLGSNCNDLTCPLTAITNFLFTIAIPLCGILILVGGFQMMTAAGNPEKFSTGKKTLLYAVIGFVVILLAGSVAALIRSIFTGS